MTIGNRYARLALIAGLTCLGSAALAKQAVLPKNSKLVAASSENNHGKTVSEAAKSGTTGPELAEIAKANPNHPPHPHSPH